MSWPTALDYQEAIQNPGTCFSDPELRSSQVECNQLGIPRPRTGAFATVYRMVGPNKAWAVRCFNREILDQQQRYAAISAQLRQLRLPYTVDFQYLPQGILVNGRWLPLLKMEWVSGESLNSYVERNLRSDSVLLALAHRWIEMLARLRVSGIAHGDLQDGNVIVVGSQIKLVDYDGMFVPALAGWLSNETGQPNYQHPNRCAADFGPFLDNFSGWIIFASLLALSRDPSLWTRFRGGDQCLLFRRTDFERPEASALFTALKRSHDAQTCAVATLIEGFLFDSVPSIPTVDASAFSTLPSAPVRPNNASSWINDHLGHAAPTSRPQGNPPGATSIPSVDWVLDFIAPERSSVVIAGRLLAERVAVALALLAVFLTGLLWSIGPAVIAGLVACCAVLAFLEIRYNKTTMASEHAARRSKVAELAGALSGALRQLKQTESDGTGIRSEAAKRLAKFNAASTALSKEESERTQTLARALQAATVAAKTQVSSLARAEASETASIQNGIGGRVAQLRTKIGQFPALEADEKRKAIQNQGKAIVQQYMKSKSIRAAPIVGIGKAYKDRLAAAGFTTAADIDYRAVQRVSGIGTARAIALTGWKDSLAAKVAAQLPTSLNVVDESSIRARFQNEAKTARTALALEEDRLKRELEAVSSKHRALRVPLDQSITTEESKYQKHLASVRQEFALKRDALSAEIKKEQENATAAERDVEAKLRQARAHVMKLQWQKGAADRDWQAVAGWSFVRFVRRVTFGR